MFSNNLRVSASNALKHNCYYIVFGVHLLFSIRKNHLNWKRKYALISRYPGRQERNKTINIKVVHAQHCGRCHIDGH